MSCGICEYEVVEFVPETLASQIVNELPLNRELTFFDGEFPSPSDAGAYVSIRRAEDGWTIARGNHGWSRPWKRESADFLMKYLERCLPVHRTDRSRERLRLTLVIPRANTAKL